MPIQLKYVEGMPVEGPELDEEALERQKRLTEYVLQEYEETGKLGSKRVCEQVEYFETYAKGHLKADG